MENIILLSRQDHVDYHKRNIVTHIDEGKNGISVYTQFGFDKFLPFTK